MKITGTTRETRKSWDSWWKDVIRHNGVLTVERFERKISLDDKNVLDVGCGHLRNKFYLQTKPGFFAGADIARKAIRKGKELYPKTALFNADAKSLPFKDRFFDVVVCTETLFYLGKDFERALKEVGRVSNESLILTFAHFEKLKATKKNETTFAGWKMYEDGYVGVDEEKISNFIQKLGYEVTNMQVSWTDKQVITRIVDGKVTQKETSLGKKVRETVYVEAQRL